MSYEIYQRDYGTQPKAPTLTISPLGRCTLNRAAAEMLHKDAVDSILLLWDKDALKFAVRPITKKDHRAFNLRYQFKDKTEKEVVGAAFSGVIFLRHIGYEMTPTGTYPFYRNDEEAIFEVQLPAERFQNSGQLVAVEGGKKNAKTASGR